MAKFTPAANLDALVLVASTPGRLKIAAEVVADAKQLAPVRTGQFRDSFAVQSSGTEVSVANTDPAAKYIELGTVDTPAHGTMAAAASRHGRYTG